MVIILKCIYPKTTKQDIRSFVMPAVKGGLFNKSGRIKSISILKLKDTRDDSLEFHGLVDIEPETVALRVMKKLTTKKIHGKPIAMGEYRERDRYNDPRLYNSHAVEIHADRRVADRRNKHKIVIDEGQFASAKTFHRKPE